MEYNNRYWAWTPTASIMYQVMTAHRYQLTSVLPQTSVLDIALAGSPPWGLAAILIPLYKVSHGCGRKYFNNDIFSFVEKAILVHGAFASVVALYNWAAPSLWEECTWSFGGSFRDPIAGKILEFVQRMDPGSAGQHINLRRGYEHHESIEGRLEQGEIMGTTTKRSGRFSYKGYLMWFDIGNRLSESQMSSMDIAEVEAYDVLRIQCPSVYKHILNDFMREVMRYKPSNALNIWSVAGPDAMLPWVKHTSPSRPLSTINLDEKFKDRLTKGIAKYLKRQRWYAHRGIPYRRGYLFKGPPGTGKSSTVQALASKYGGQLYSLVTNEIRDETHLRELFSIPKKGDFLLIEDIDHNNRAMSTDQDQAGCISQAGLLNAIDGPNGLHMGVVLVMTCNNAESIDSSLKRPGRIDEEYDFGFASREVAKFIFTRIYEKDEEDEKQEEENEEGENEEEEAREGGGYDLEVLAIQFAAAIPDKSVTPAEIEELLISTSNPSEAVAAARNGWAIRIIASRGAEN